MLELICWLLLALVHAVPALAFLMPSLLTRLYGVARGDTIFLLMQHRAALFLMVFVICIWSAFDPTPRRLASISVAISMLSFLMLYAMQGAPASLRQIAVADLIALPALGLAMWKAFAAP